MLVVQTSTLDSHCEKESYGIPVLILLVFNLDNEYK